MQNLKEQHKDIMDGAIKAAERDTKSKRDRRDSELLSKLSDANHLWDKITRRAYQHCNFKPTGARLNNSAHKIIIAKLDKFTFRYIQVSKRRPCFMINEVNNVHLYNLGSVTLTLGLGDKEIRNTVDLGNFLLDYDKIISRLNRRQR